MSQERCDYCMPESKEIFGNVGNRMSIEGLTAIRDGLEEQGRVLYCGDTKEVCMPLLRVQRQIEKNKKG